MNRAAKIMWLLPSCKGDPRLETARHLIRDLDRWKTWEKIEIVAVIFDQPAKNQPLDEYAHRMCIEESFRDNQSGGFDLEHTRLEV